MVMKRVPTGVKLLIGVVIYILTFLLARPSDPVTKGEREFWIKAAELFGERDAEGFIGIALLIGCFLVTLVSYLTVIHIVEKKLNENH
ncbi:hypothetical protein V6M93_11155 [Pectobacterium brasiliense]|uniref:Uncharacterized protein n=2 Tax=Pectobacterium brasiliense TaxID=180957 RepID=A0AAW9HDB7_9GAMM|nr:MULTISPECIES: hypothetical protein [Pectobacterium]ARA76961.1 hypothetical protein B5S52_14130 [Pectobacterium brasiliense]KHS75129.1 hypothetical protein RC79_00525 [Pectobacterium brasiliense]KHS81101.1 hypothetical protein RC81_00530 [Pectobacterium brasiliense]KHS86848.1 hypothetical protein RC83_14105 [Pectobacterium brasiliense]KHT01491.1 hypothetical protein RC90_00515 [Pectobacterium brasiliense]